VRLSLGFSNSRARGGVESAAVACVCGVTALCVIFRVRVSVCCVGTARLRVYYTCEPAYAVVTPIVSLTFSCRELPARYYCHIYTVGCILAVLFCVNEHCCTSAVLVLTTVFTSSSTCLHCSACFGCAASAAVHCMHCSKSGQCNICSAAHLLDLCCLHLFKESCTMAVLSCCSWHTNRFL
jgi:hypothetical protein